MKWWQEAVFYQVYPRSFADGNGDGIGDLPGLISKLDYLQDLGIDAIWLSPHYPSPMVDCGYDISDYCQVAPEYGSLDDFQTLVDELHRRNMKLVLDLVLNHTSDQHPWFLEARSSRENLKHDWYVWLKGTAEKLPNNWYSTFGGPAWEWNEATGEYYYHFFYKEQPDLNWQNPVVREAMFEMVRFWLRMGVDGFRLDAVGTIFENTYYPDQSSGMKQEDLYRAYRLVNSEEERQTLDAIGEEMYLYQHDCPDVHSLMKELRQVVDEFDDRVLIGETDDLTFYGNGSDELHLVFNFPLMRTHRLSAGWVKQNQRTRLSGIPAEAWPCNTLNNHDTGRVFSNLGDGVHDEELAKLSLASILLLKGTPVLFNGEEIGMRNQLNFSLDQFRDPISLRIYELERRLLKTPAGDALSIAARNGRDKGRTPMTWDSSPNGGFCPEGSQPWLPVGKDYLRGVNVCDQMASGDSLWQFYKSLLHLRKQIPTLMGGEYQSLELKADAFGFLRFCETQKALILLNYTENEVITESKDEFQPARWMFSSIPDSVQFQNPAEIHLQPFEIWIGLIEG